MQPAKNTRMKTTIEEIRRRNLEILVDEYKTQAAVARAAKVQRHGLSQILTQCKNSRGKTTVMGSTMARQLEAGCCKPLGWMDVNHDTVEESELIKLYNGMSNEMREMLLAHARLIVKLPKE